VGGVVRVGGGLLGGEGVGCVRECACGPQVHAREPPQEGVAVLLPYLQMQYQRI
jgi:hypothetical protein